MFEVVRAEVVVAIRLGAGVDGLEELDLIAVCNFEAGVVLVLSAAGFAVVLSSAVVVSRGNVFELAGSGRARLVFRSVVVVGVVVGAFWVVFGAVVGSAGAVVVVVVFASLGLASDAATSVALAEVAGFVVAVVGGAASPDESNVNGASNIAFLEFFMLIAEKPGIAGINNVGIIGGRVGGRGGGGIGGGGGFEGGASFGGGVGGGSSGGGSDGGSSLRAIMDVASLAVLADAAGFVTTVGTSDVQDTSPGHAATAASSIAWGPRAEGGVMAVNGARVSSGVCAVGIDFLGGLTLAAVGSDNQDGLAPDLTGRAAGGRACGPYFPIASFAVHRAGGSVAGNRDLFKVADDRTCVLAHAGDARARVECCDLTLAKLEGVAAAEGER